VASNCCDSGSDGYDCAATDSVPVFVLPLLDWTMVLMTLRTWKQCVVRSSPMEADHGVIWRDLFRGHGEHQSAISNVDSLFFFFFLSAVAVG